MSYSCNHIRLCIFYKDSSESFFRVFSFLFLHRGFNMVNGTNKRQRDRNEEESNTILAVMLKRWTRTIHICSLAEPANQNKNKKKKNAKYKKLRNIREKGAHTNTQIKIYIFKLHIFFYINNSY